MIVRPPQALSPQGSQGAAISLLKGAKTFSNNIKNSWGSLNDQSKMALLSYYPNTTKQSVLELVRAAEQLKT